MEMVKVNHILLYSPYSFFSFASQPPSIRNLWKETAN
jgi:hypothetical protein